MVNDPPLRRGSMLARAGQGIAVPLGCMSSGVSAGFRAYALGP